MVNWDTTAALCGEDTDMWPGKRIELYPTTTLMGGKTTPCIRVREPSELPLSSKTASAPTPPPPTDEPDDEQLDDEVPF